MPTELLSRSEYSPRRDSVNVAVDVGRALVDDLGWPRRGSAAIKFITLFTLRWYRELHSRYSDGFTRVKHAQGLWSSPYYDCEYSGHWLVTYAAPIMVSSVSNSSTADTQLGNVGTRRADNETVPEEEMPRKMIGISTVSLNLNHLDMDQCPGDDPFFANTHLCDTSNSKVSAAKSNEVV